ncbi:F-box protein [Forsythia ovata]|uniref:F-box protein n=1 Tax=Forsythia ovata TaxID=205694 RepID=A0ABD1NZZ9_9LAMI
MQSLPDSSRSHNSSTQNLHEFDGIKNLRTELPSGYLRLEKGTMIKWVAKFGKALKSCVILGFRNSGTVLEGMVDFNNMGAPENDQRLLAKGSLSRPQGYSRNKASSVIHLLDVLFVTSAMQ